MKIIKAGAAVFILVAATFTLIGCQPSGNGKKIDASQSAIVIIKFKAQPEKGAETVSELTKLIESVKLEPNFIGIKLHIDTEDNTNILLYEEWRDVNYYKTDHMDTDHIKEFMAKSSNFLTGPPEITFWEMTRDFR